MKNNLIERYIYAVTKRMPEKTRNDVSSEILTLIEDMLEERCGDITPTEKDITVVLTELGTPLELYEEYNVDGKKALIGSPYYTPYKFVLKIVFVAVLIGMMVSGIVKGLIVVSQLGEGIIEVNTFADFSVDFFVDFITNSILGLFSALGIVTFIFVVLQHFKVDIFHSTSLKDLPPVPKKKELLSRGESIFEIIATVVGTILILTMPNLLVFEFSTDGFSTGELSMFNVEAVRSSSYLIILLAVTAIIPEIIKLIEGIYNKKTMMTTIIFNSISAIIASVWLMNYQIFQFPSADMPFGQNNGISDWIATYSQDIALGVMLFAMLIDTLIVVYKSTRKTNA